MANHCAHITCTKCGKRYSPCCEECGCGNNKKKLKPEAQLIWDKLKGYHADEDFVKTEFKKRGLKLQNITETIVYKATGFVYVYGHLSTESLTAEVAIMKNLIKGDIVSNDNNYQK